jgi:hypothetical protein
LSRARDVVKSGFGKAQASNALTRGNKRSFFNTVVSAINYGQLKISSHLIFFGGKG